MLKYIEKIYISKKYILSQSIINKFFVCVLEGIPARETPGIFGYISGYLAVVEPQMRKALHEHMLIQLLGFAHPQDIFGNEVLPNIFVRLWYFVASISFRSRQHNAELHRLEALEWLLRSLLYSQPT